MFASFATNKTETILKIHKNIFVTNFSQNFPIHLYTDRNWLTQNNVILDFMVGIRLLFKRLNFDENWITTIICIHKYCHPVNFQFAIIKKYIIIACNLQSSRKREKIVHFKRFKAIIKLSYYFQHVRTEKTLFSIY